MDQKGFHLSDYIAGFAIAAASAQDVLSKGENPMVIKSFRFKFNVTADFKSKAGSNGQVDCRVKPLKVKDQMMTDYKEYMGIEIECTLVSTFGDL